MGERVGESHRSQRDAPVQRPGTKVGDGPWEHHLLEDSAIPERPFTNAMHLILVVSDKPDDEIHQSGFVRSELRDEQAEHSGLSVVWL